MYFVVYSTDDNEYFVIPKNWIENVNFAQIVNGIINSNIVYKCYCGDDKGAFMLYRGERQERPNLQYVPRFDKGQLFYMAKLMKYFGKLYTFILELWLVLVFSRNNY